MTDKISQYRLKKGGAIRAAGLGCGGRRERTLSLGDQGALSCQERVSRVYALFRRLTNTYALEVVA